MRRMPMWGMPRPWRIRYPGARYHVTSRGNGRQAIFFSREDYARFQDQLTAALEQDDVILYAYVLMPNHYHLLITTPRGNIQRFMQRLNTAYSMYARYKHARPGHCLEGRYKAKLVDSDDYALRLTRYTHLNPVRVRRLAGQPVSAKQAMLTRYEWSSYGGYVNGACEEEMLDYRWLRMMGCKTSKGNRSRYRKYVESFLTEGDPVLEKALKASRYVVGDESSIEQAEEDLKEQRVMRGVYGRDIQWPDEQRIGIGTIESAIEAEFGIRRADLRYHGRRLGKIKAVAIELCCQLSGKTQREIGEHFGYTSESSVGKQRQRLRASVEEDEKLAVQMAKIKKRLASL